jgi:hypothetical protein
MLSRVVARKAFEVNACPCTLLSSFSENWGEVLEDVGQVYNLPFSVRLLAAVSVTSGEVL